MPEGGENAQKTFIADPPDETASLLAAEKAKSAGDLRTQAANDNYADDYNPYTEEPENDNAITEELVAYPQEQEYENTDQAYQAQLDADQQTEIALAMANKKQRDFRQLQTRINQLESELSEFEKDLLDFKKSSLGGFLAFFRPKINLLIDALISDLKKGLNNLTDEAKVSYYTGLITTISSLIGILTAFKLLAAFLDAAFIHNISCLKLVVKSFETIVIPIILILISPIYILFLGVIFFIGKTPLLKGKFTQNLIKLIAKLKKQREAWQVELARAKKKVALRRQIKALKEVQKQIKNAK